jgi:hypothetical protein
LGFSPGSTPPGLKPRSKEALIRWSRHAGPALPPLLRAKIFHELSRRKGRPSDFTSIAMFSIGAAQDDATLAYIVGQREHHKKRDFQAEFIVFLKKHRIEYDSRYVWG